LNNVSLGSGGTFGVDRSDQYRRFAHECLEMARTSETDHTRVILIQMAQVWFRLAEALENDDARMQLASLAKPE
jgi:hypothetical protein